MDSDEDEDEEEKKGLTETGKQIKKALLKHQKTRVYASDDEKDPYASVRYYHRRDFFLYLGPIWL